MTDTDTNVDRFFQTLISGFDTDLKAVLTITGVYIFAVGMRHVAFRITVFIYVRSLFVTAASCKYMVHRDLCSQCKMQISSPPPPVYDCPLTLCGHVSHKFHVMHGIFA